MVRPVFNVGPAGAMVGSPIRSACQGLQGGIVIRFVGNFRNELAIDDLAVFVHDHHGRVQKGLSVARP